MKCCIIYPSVTGVCPTCGTCPTCGSRPWHYRTPWVYPALPRPIWVAPQPVYRHSAASAVRALAGKAA